jgi:hypothetical protein
VPYVRDWRIDDENATDEYSASEWQEIAAGASFGDLPDDQVLVLYRHWLWADYSHEVLRDEIEEWEPALSDRFMMGRDLWANYVYCGLLYVLIEGMTQRRVRYQGGLAKDIRRIREPLNKARDATFHVGESYWDARLSQLLDKADAEALVRVHSALGSLLRAELSRRPLDLELRGLLGLDDVDD